MNWEQALSKTSSQFGGDGEVKRVQARSKMSTVAIMEVRRRRAQMGTVEMYQS